MTVRPLNVWYVFDVYMDCTETRQEQVLNVCFQVCVFLNRYQRCPSWRLMDWYIFEFLLCNHCMDFYSTIKYFVFFWYTYLQRWPSWPLINWDVSTFCATPVCISTNHDRNQVLDDLFGQQIRLLLFLMWWHIVDLLCKRLIDFNKTLQGSFNPATIDYWG